MTTAKILPRPTTTTSNGRPPPMRCCSFREAEMKRRRRQRQIPARTSTLPPGRSSAAWTSTCRWATGTASTPSSLTRCSAASTAWSTSTGWNWTANPSRWFAWNGPTFPMRTSFAAVVSTFRRQFGTKKNALEWRSAGRRIGASRMCWRRRTMLVMLLSQMKQQLLVLVKWPLIGRQSGPFPVAASSSYSSPSLPSSSTVVVGAKCLRQTLFFQEVEGSSSSSPNLDKIRPCWRSGPAPLLQHLQLGPLPPPPPRQTPRRPTVPRRATTTASGGDRPGQRIS